MISLTLENGRRCKTTTLLGHVFRLIRVARPCFFRPMYPKVVDTLCDWNEDMVKWQFVAAAENRCIFLAKNETSLGRFGWGSLTEPVALVTLDPTLEHYASCLH